MASSKTETDRSGLIRALPRAFGSQINLATSDSEENLLPAKAGKGQKINPPLPLKSRSGGALLVDHKENIDPLNQASRKQMPSGPLNQASRNQMPSGPLNQASRKQRPLSPLRQISRDEMLMLDEAQLAERAARLRNAVRWMQKQEEKLDEEERRKKEMEKEMERKEMEHRRVMEEQRQKEQGRRLMEEGRRMMEERQKNEHLNLNNLLLDGLPNWAEIPTPALSIIFEKLGAAEYCASAQAVCRSWRYLALISPLQPCIDVRDLSTSTSCFYYLNDEKLARRAVDCTRGPFRELHVKSVSGAFLDHVADRCYRLRSCSLIWCGCVSPKALINFLRRCPLLEELNIYRSLFLHETYGQIAQACPQLKRLSINTGYNDESNITDSDSDYSNLRKSIKWDDVYDESVPSDPDSDDDPVSNSESFLSSGVYLASDPDSDDDPVSNSESFLSSGDYLALEIANNMPQLHELRIMRDLTLTNKGLNFILDGCHHLQTLELRCCYYIRVDSVLYAKLDKIKNVKLSRRSVRVLSKILGKQLYV